jgi:hypothetical protein
MVERKGIETERKSLIFKARHLSLCHGTPTDTPLPWRAVHTRRWRPLDERPGHINDARPSPPPPFARALTMSQTRD